MNDPIRSVAMARQGVERRGGVDAAAQQRFLAMLASVRPVEAGTDQRASTVAAPRVDDAQRPASAFEPATGRDMRREQRAADPAATPSDAGRITQVRRPLAVGHASRAAFEVAPAAASFTEGQAPAAQPAGQAAGSQQLASQPAVERPVDLGRAGPRDGATRDVAPRDAATRDGAARASGRGAQFTSPSSVALQAVAGEMAAGGMNEARRPMAFAAAAPALQGAPMRAAMQASGVAPGAAEAGRGRVPRDASVEALLLAGASEARSSMAALAMPEEAGREMPPVAAELPLPAPRPDLRAQAATRAAQDATEAEAGAGAAPDAPDAELGALLRHLAGSGTPLRAQRMADGSWVARLVFPGEGAVSLRIVQSPELVSVRLGGDGELARRVRDAIEGGPARAGRRLAVDLADAA